LAQDKNSSAGERTEEATPRRLEEARKRGQVGKSADFNAAVSLCGMVLVLYALKGYISTIINAYYKNFFAHSLLVKTEDFSAVLLGASFIYFRILIPFFIAAIILALASNLIQIGFVFTLEPLKFKIEKFNLVEGMRKVFSLKTLGELAKNLIKLTLIAAVIVSAIKKNILGIFSLSNGGIPQIVLIGVKIIVSVTGAVIICYLGIALADLFYQKYRYKKGLRMTKQEVKEEFKQTEGNPQVKSKIREKQRQMSTGRMIKEVPEATVVVTNPTHYAVALKYDRRAKDAPFVVAKGMDLWAERIKQIARENDVPLVENKTVAQLLYRQVDIGDVIPNELYQAVAEILAVVYRKHHKKF
jgi:flagellar biosynthetic protein FlhB